MGSPAFDLQDDLLGPVDQFLGLPASLFIITRGRGQDAQKRQPPDSLRPGNLGQQLHAQPAQATGLIGDRLAGAGRISVDAPGRDAPAPPTLDRFIQTKDQGTGLAKGQNQLVEQKTSPHAGGPLRPIEHPVVILELDDRAQAQHAQDGTDRPFAGCQDGSEQQFLSIRPNATGKERSEGLKKTDRFRTRMKQHPGIVATTLGQIRSNPWIFFHRPKGQIGLPKNG